MLSVYITIQGVQSHFTSTSPLEELEETRADSRHGKASACIPEEPRGDIHIPGEPLSVVWQRCEARVHWRRRCRIPIRNSPTRLLLLQVLECRSRTAPAAAAPRTLLLLLLGARGREVVHGRLPQAAHRQREVAVQKWQYRQQGRTHPLLQHHGREETQPQPPRRPQQPAASHLVAAARPQQRKLQGGSDGGGKELWGGGDRGYNRAPPTARFLVLLHCGCSCLCDTAQRSAAQRSGVLQAYLH